jgi:excisionase family DNA binding protein
MGRNAGFVDSASPAPVNSSADTDRSRHVALHWPSGVTAKPFSSTQQEFSMGEKYLRPKKAAEKYGVSTETLRKWANEGKIRAAKLPNGDRRYYESHIRRLMELPERPLDATRIRLFARRSR